MTCETRADQLKPAKDVTLCNDEYEKCQQSNCLCWSRHELDGVGVIGRII